VKRSKPLRRRTALQSHTLLGRRSELRRVPLQRGTTPAARTPRQAVNDRRDAQWRELVYTTRGRFCRACGESRADRLQVDHLIPRSPATRWEPRNGLVLCGDFGAGRCHPRKTAHQLLVDRSWLDEDQTGWLEEQGHAVWQPDGSVGGRHCRLFAPVD
jgi:5-methylcytosine-specific restriction endonuclease McrA